MHGVFLSFMIGLFTVLMHGDAVILKASDRRAEVVRDFKEDVKLVCRALEPRKWDLGAGQWQHVAY
jgi:hypothetical protein